MSRASLNTLALVAVFGAACSAPPEEEKETRTYKFKALAGISMGAIGTAWLTGEGGAGELDAIATLGGPVDAAYFLDNMERNIMGGFCPIETLEALAKEDPAKLDDPSALDCASGRKYFEYELPQNFNHWRFTNDGGSFDRDSYLDIFEDLALAMGNPLSGNEASGVFPFPEYTKAIHTSQLCTTPLTLTGVKHREFNPEGKHALITFCDGEEPAIYCDDASKTPVDYCTGKTAAEFCEALSAKPATADINASRNPDFYYDQMGRYDPCRPHTRPVAFGLAVDINGNGKRDFHEPVVVFARERYQDTGADGCFNDKEDGKGGCTASGATGDPNGDDFHLLDNPLGTQSNFQWDDGEPFEDLGLDGVAGTSDYGEGNGVYDDSPHRKRFLQRDLRRRLMSMTQKELKSLDVYTDGGIRDVFNLGLSGDVIHSALRALVPEDTRRWTSFLDIPSVTGEPWARGFYDGELADYDKLGRNVFLRYGSADDTVEEIRGGAGDHVGNGAQLISRFTTFQMWLNHVWKAPLGEPERIQSTPPPQEEIVYFSEALQAKRNFGIALPPGYDLPENKDRRYPMFLLMHGYGMDAGSMSTMQLLFNSFMGSGDLRPMIVVYPSGRCCFKRPDGTKDCREIDENGEALSRTPGYVRECIRGNFYQNRVGYEPGDTTLYGDAIFELMDYVEKNYRVLAPMTVEVP